MMTPEAAMIVASSSITGGDLLAGGITIVVFLVIPFVIWIIRSLIGEAKRRTADSLNLASIAKSNQDLNHNFTNYAEKNDQTIVGIKQDIAAIQAIQQIQPVNGHGRPHD